MARPKRTKDDPSVPERLEEAFLEMMREMPYRDITITALSRKTGVNHNSFYYYFENMDDMVAHIIDHTLLPEIPQYFLKGFPSGSAGSEYEAIKKEFEKRALRISPLIGENSTPWIMNRLEDAILDLWLSSLGIDKERTPFKWGVLLHFWMGGVFAVWGRYGKDRDPFEFMEVVQSAFAPALTSTVCELRNEYGKAVSAGIGIA